MRKKISVFSSTITLTILITLLVFNLNAKKVGTEIWDATWRSLIPEGLISDDSGIKEWFNSIFSNEESGEENGNIIDIESIKKMMEEFQITEETQKESTEEFSGDYMEKLAKYVESQEQQYSKQSQQLLSVLRFLSSVKIKYILMILIFMVTGSVAITLNSYHKWIPSFSWAMALSGGATILLCELAKKYILSLLKVEVTLNALIDPAQYLILGGIIIRIIYFAIESISNINKKIDKEEKNEISEVPEQ